MKIKLSLVLFILFTFATTTAVCDSPKVYVCQGSSKSSCYHRNANCRGLSNCKGSIISMSRDKAVKEGRRPCKICYGN